DSVRLENCLRSLALEKCPNLRNFLCLLHIDISRPKFDFKPPSRTLTSRGKPIRKLNFDLDERAVSVPLATPKETATTQLIEMYKSNDQKVLSIMPEGKLDHRSPLKARTKPTQWTYPLLIETPVIAQMIDLMVEGFRANWEQMINQNKSLEQREIHWCILIDNSGSMSIHRNAIYESLVVLMEFLRKLESKFAVARFGGRTNQKILKNMDDLFTNQDGQYVLEALTFDEGTYPATGLARVADLVFPRDKLRSSSDIIVHQCVVMITDGLTQEREDTTYTGTTDKYGLDLGILFIETGEAETSEVLLEYLKNVTNVKIKSDKMHDLPHLMPQLLHQMTKKCLEKAIKKKQEFIPLSTIQVVVPSYDGTIPVPSKLEIEKFKYSSFNPSSYVISSPTAIIPNLALVQASLPNYLSSTTEFTNCASSAISELRKYYQTLNTETAIIETEKAWLNEEHRFSALIDDVSTVLGDVVFPFNKFTRRRAALHGSSLYMPGVIKAMTSEWNYKKIFGVKLAGGKRDHTVCLVIDVSTSMFGTLAMGTLEGLVVLIAALQKIAIDNFSIVIFGRNVRLIKTNEQRWDALSIYTLMQQLRFDLDEGTRDADGIEVAIDLLGQYSTRGEKKIFIVTDGYTSCGTHLAKVQRRADENSIDVVAMAIGLDQTNLKNVYKRYFQCATVYGLPKAFRALFENETQLTSSDWSQKRILDEVEASRKQLQHLFHAVESEKIFESMITELADHRDMKLLTNAAVSVDLSVDICFCLDCTGSMSRWIAAMKAQMHEIITGIRKQIDKKYPQLKLKVKLRFAIVGYRDVRDNPRFFNCDFKDQTNEVIQFLETLTASGGDDLPEDVLGALHTCLKLPGWKAKHARFIIVITDAPGHGELNDKLKDDYPQGVGVHTLNEICERLLMKDHETELLFYCMNERTTKKMTNAFQNYYAKQRDKTDKRCVVIYPFKDNEPATQSFHFVFVLDGSVSMAHHWTALLQAYAGFIQVRKRNQGEGDIFSVVQFSDEGRIEYEQKDARNARTSIEQWRHSTNYCAGLAKAEEVIERDSSNSPIIMIFMSDGKDRSEGNPTKLVRDLRNKYAAKHNFICHTVAFGAAIAGDQNSLALLKNMATAGAGDAHMALDDKSLKLKFVEIATNNKTTAELVESFSKTLSREISNQIVADFL
ncbi:unnamed protein product, partial [Rotaria sordida]